MKVLKKNIILKELIILFLFILIPLIIISSLFLINSNTKLINETLKSINEKNQLFADDLDEEFNKINKSSSTVTVHSKVRKLSYINKQMSNYEKSLAVSQIREYITNIKDSSELISNIKVYIPSELKVYNTENFKAGSFQKITIEDYSNIIAAKNSNSSPIYYDSSHSKLNTIIFSSIKNPSNIVEVDFSIKQLSKRLAAQGLYDGSYYLFYLNNSVFEMNNIKDDSLLKLIQSTNYKNGIATLHYASSEYKAFCSKLEYADAYYIQIVPSDAFIKPYQLSIYYTIFFVIFMLICLLIYSIGAIKLINQPLSQLVNAFQSVEKGNLDVRINETEGNEFNYLFDGFNKMTEHLETLIDEVYNQNLLLQKAEFKQLQTQINPHFLYNSFFMLQRMIQNGIQAEAIQVSKELGIYFKYITRNDSDFVLFKDEYCHAKIYSNIQSLRFEGRISTEFGALPEAYEKLQVPRLILQPIIENAYNYGLENKVSDGLLRVIFNPIEREQDEGIEIIIEDNGNDLSDEVLKQINSNLEQVRSLETPKEITGILNIYRRIQIFYKNSSTLSVTRSELGGMKVTIYLIQKSRSDLL